MIDNHATETASTQQRVGKVCIIRNYALLLTLLSMFFTAFAYGSSSAKEILTAEERLWLTNNQSRLVLAVETGYAPFVFLDSKNQPTGLAHDYMLLLEAKLGAHFKQERFSSLDDIFKKVRSGEVHIVNAVTKTPQRSTFLAFTDPFVFVPNVIVVRKDRSTQMREESLSGLKVSLVKSYAATEDLTNKNLGFSPDLVPDDLTALLNVSFGRSDAAVIDLATASYLITQKGITNLRVAGETTFGIRLSMGAPIGEPVLLSILQKGLDATTEAERQEMRNRWINISSQSILTDWRFWGVVGSVLFIALVVITGILIWNRTLRKEIAERIEAERKLAESEQRYRTVAFYTYDWEYWQGANLEIVYISPSCERVTGYSPAEFAADPGLLDRIVLPADRNIIVSHQHNDFYHDEALVDFRIVHRDGGIRWITHGCRAVYGADGQFMGRRVSNRDDTERKLATEALQRIEWMLAERPTTTLPTLVTQAYGDLTQLNTSRVILDGVGYEMLAEIVGLFMHMLGTSSAVYEKNGDYAFGIFSSGWCKFMDMTSRRLCNTPDNREALCGGHWLCHESCWNEASRKSIETGQPTDIECAGGIHLYAVPIRAGDEIVGSINVGYGDPPKDSAKLQELADKYGVSVDDLCREADAYPARPLFIIDMAKNRLLFAARLIGEIVQRKRSEQELKRSNTELEQFSYAISHDMRQPLRMISSYLQLLEKSLAGQLDGDQREFFGFAIDGAKRLDQMLVALLEYSRVGRKGEPPMWIESRALLNEALLFLQPAIAEAQAKLDIAGSWPRVCVSRNEMTRLLQNLIGNAVKYRVAERKPEIIVTSETVGDEWRLSISDNGIGILPDQAHRLFQVFQRLHTRAVYEGTGIGLALCRKIAEHHGGQIGANSQGEGLGSTFWVKLPLHVSDVPENTNDKSANGRLGVAKSID